MVVIRCYRLPCSLLVVLRIVVACVHAAEMRSMGIRDVMERIFPIVDPDTKIETLLHLLQEYAAVLVDRGGREYGIVTKHDLLRTTSGKLGHTPDTLTEPR